MPLFNSVGGLHRAVRGEQRAGSDVDSGRGWFVERRRQLEPRFDSKLSRCDRHFQ